jgi:aerobic-type carbon monoxide dehydrogenase small subunit (CoxS/CutS family)
MIMQAAALLKKNPKPSVPEIKAASAEQSLAAAGTHMRIVRAIKRASEA